MESIRRRAALATSALVVVSVIASMGAQAGGTSRATGGKVVGHRNGKVVPVSNAPKTQTNSIGGTALEPTLGLTPGGDVFYAAAGFTAARGYLAATQILRSEDGGRTWTNTSPRVLDQNTMPVSLDPYVVVDDLDGDNARIFSIDLTVACSYLSFSDDGGESWITNPLACGRPVNDHQTLFTGPPATSTTIGYPHVLYYCWNDVATSSCSKSIDGGLTFRPTGSPAFLGANEDRRFCGGLHGHGVVDSKGTIYLPREYCDAPYVSISKDEGVTWTNVKVSDVPADGGTDPSVAVDKAGNIYYSWVHDLTRQVMLAVSKDGGNKWSKSVVASLPQIKEANLPTLTVGAPGKVALAYYGSTNSPFAKCKRECSAGDYVKTTWNGYLAITTDALSANPTFVTGTINDPKDPLVRQRCGPGRCKSVFDFIDVAIGPDGMPYAAFVDDCMKDCTEITPDASDYEGLVAKFVGGPRLK
ncbi:MAG TPA: sialidase family protein [Actinomycetota bacterium]|nr:sialidase family protein [Actinomycetota bacterium]